MATYVRKGPKIRRNDPCLCGSGSKYKHCCLHKAQEVKVPPRTQAAEATTKIRASVNKVAAWTTLASLVAFLLPAQGRMMPREAKR